MSAATLGFAAAALIFGLNIGFVIGAAWCSHWTRLNREEAQEADNG